MVMVTEPVFGSLHNIQTSFRDVPTASEDRQTCQTSQLEHKYGLIHLAETLQFLHQEANMTHCNINPETIIITKDGSWKLSGFTFSTNATDYASQVVSFEYSSQPPPWEEVTRVRTGLASIAHAS